MGTKSKMGYYKEMCTCFLTLFIAAFIMVMWIRRDEPDFFKTVFEIGIIFGLCLSMCRWMAFCCQKNCPDDPEFAEPDDGSRQEEGQVHPAINQIPRQQWIPPNQGPYHALMAPVIPEPEVMDQRQSQHRQHRRHNMEHDPMANRIPEPSTPSAPDPDPPDIPPPAYSEIESASPPPYDEAVTQPKNVT